MLGEKEARKLCQQILSQCGGQPVEVLIFSEDSALTRFANNIIHQNVAERNTSLILCYFIGKRMGTATTNRLDSEAITEIIARARINAETSPENTDYPGLPDPADYAPITAFDPQTAEYSPKVRAQVVSEVCRLAESSGLNASGAFATGSGEVMIANSQGVNAYFASTTADFQTVVMSENSSGRAHASAWRAADLSGEALGREAVEKAERGRDPRPVEAVEYTVVLDAYVTEDLLQMLDFHGMSAQSVFEGRSWMNDLVGQKAMSEKISIWDDGLDLTGFPMPFDFEGVPKQRVNIVQQGVVMSPVYDRYTAARMGKTTTGHAMPPTFRGMGPLATSLFMSPGDASLEDMIRSTESGLYITRFWYTRLVHPKGCIITGMTRDGVFMIEHGQITFPVKNLRFTQSYVDALANVEMVGKDTRLLASEFGGIAVRVPALKIARFNFTGTTV
jgi:PmbA protein